MTGKPLRLVSVGRLKTPFWKDAAAHYLTRITRWRRLQCTEVRDGDAALPPDRRNALEGRRILDALEAQDVPLVLDERGAALTSPQLANLLRQLDRTGAKKVYIHAPAPDGVGLAVYNRLIRAAAFRVVEV